MDILDFEKTFLELQDQILALKTLPGDNKLKIEEEIRRLEEKGRKLLVNIYKGLTPWQKVQVARHAQRPKAGDYIQRLIQSYVPLCGDRCFGEDQAMLSGIGFFHGKPVVVLGHEKGSDTESRIHHNFGMAHPEGYRKAIRLMDLADRFGFPVLCFVDTAGAYAGIGAEERGQAQAIAACMEKSLSISSPVLSVIIGEGGSGGAVALACANYIFMLEHSIYSVISPEGCASILWRSVAKKEEAAVAQKLTAQDLKKLNVIDDIIPEPLGGAHRNQTATIDAVGDRLFACLENAVGLSKEDRQKKFLAIGRQFLMA
jgi:acetyl-CoA carboxylase carboxyl transferase subunit alpha